jgi:hypothetical protein
MKKSYIIVALLVLVALSGCEDSFLNRDDQTKITPSTFWKSQNDAYLALNGCYGVSIENWKYTYDDAASDNCYAQYPWESSSTNIGAGNILPTTVNRGYISRYVAIRQYNFFLDNVGKTPMDAALMARYVAEVKFLRALTYFELARNFGPVPLLKELYTTPAEAGITPTAEVDVIAFVISELASAATALPNSYTGGSNNETGRATKGAALALKSRVELHYGKYADAAASAQQVMGLGYQLFRVATLTAADTKDDFSSFVTFATPADATKFYKGLASYQQQFWSANDNNKEVIFTAQSIALNKDYSYYTGNGLNTLMLPSNEGGWSSITPTVELINAYWDKNGNTFTPPPAATRATNYNSGTPSAAYYDEFKNRDTRLYASILFPSAPWSRVASPYVFKWPGSGNNTSRTGYNFVKLVDPATANKVLDGAQDFPILRYAEVLLNYAEAKNEASGPDANIYAALNDIRDRVGMPAVNETMYNTKDLLRQYIRAERRVELAGEGQRMWDIRRWNIAATVMTNIYSISNGLAQTRNWDPKFMKMPYPQSAVDHNANLKAAQATKGY